MLSPQMGPGAAGNGTLARHIARAKERDMNFVITPEDLTGMEQIARVSSRGPALGAADFGGHPQRWTELAIYYRKGMNRPFVPVVEGRSSIRGEKMRFQYAAMGTLERAVNWFQGSHLRDELLAAIPEDWQPQPAGGELAQDLGEAGPALARADEPHDDEPPFYRGPDRLTEVLRWLYPHASSDLALATAFEKDFGVPARSARNTLAIEDGRAIGNVGPWLPPFIAAMRFFDKRTWEKRRG